MEYVAFNYFPTPAEGDLYLIAEAVYSSEARLTHLSNNDPPKKWSGSKQDFLEMLIQDTNLTKYVFARDVKLKIEIDFALSYHPEAEFSTLSISGQNRDVVESFCTHFVTSLKSYLCISGELNLGQKQHWAILRRSDCCPQQLIDLVINA